MKRGFNDLYNALDGQMKQKRRFPVGLVVGGLAILAAAAGALYVMPGKPGAESERIGNLAGAAIGGRFSLMDQNGNLVTNDSLKGRWRLIYFGYTYCPDICPVDAQKMGKALQLLEKQDPIRAALVQPIFITVDPERDTPAAVGEFARQFHPRMIGLTGSPKQVQDAMAVHRVYAKKQGKPGDVDYLVDHSTMIYLMDKAGAPVAFFTREQSAETIAKDLAQFVK